MSAYVIFQFTVINQDKLQDYVTRALPTVIKHGGRQIGAGASKGLNEENLFDRAAVFEFLDGPSALAWYESEEYRSLFNLRKEAMNCSITLIG